MIRQSDNFMMKNYGRESTFASFLPGISGIRGIPIWCYYVNRGQCVVSFGVDNKDHAIMEFYPAHQAYQNVKTTGFRTFLKINGTVTEAFSDETVPHCMQIAANGLEIEERNEETGILTHVTYFTLPGENLGALVRKVEVQNISAEKMQLELLDGMPAVIPYGVGVDSMKNMGQTTKAWMQVEDAETGLPYYRVRVSMDDTAAVAKIEGGNFTAGTLSDGKLLMPIVDPMLVFSYDTSMRRAVGFEEMSLAELSSMEQITTNQLPCSFYGVERELAAGESITLYEMIGQVEKKKLLENFFAEKKDCDYFEAKKKEADELVKELCAGIDTHTASADFDAYCKYTYMDNVLRGGYPMQLGSNKIFYVYSRKHGDLERDYNYFSMLPEFYSQGNGNFRDVNQNRRCDTFFAPFVGRENIKEFYSLIQLDGYNPLGVEKLTYQLKPETAGQLFEGLDKAKREELTAFTTKAFTPGALYRKMDEVFGDAWNESLFFQIIDFADSLVNGNFGEGYWSDHWTYNLDLILDYLEIFPEQEREMLYEEDYTCFLAQVNVNRRMARYAETENGLRQYHALNESTRRETEEKLVRTEYGKGEILHMSLFEKLILLCTTKFATLDAYGMGVEMEGGKPGWYDALNGMPGMFGSSMAETYELCRMLEYTIGALKKYPGEIRVIEELGCLIDELHLICRIEGEALKTQDMVLSFWNRINDVKEMYRDKTFSGISGKKMIFTSENLAEVLEGFLAIVKRGIAKAVKLGGGICPTYFTYEVPQYEVTAEGIRPLAFTVKPVPYFLEGPVRYLKLNEDKETKRALYEHVKNSDLYDTKLSMYKVNASLKDASFELGRARAFTPGWLENESIWLHMEYKYLLELLRSGLYTEFFEDFHKAAIPFLDPKVYGRSIYENSSFIASSKNPNKAYHGKGFVARLSGSTIEFISMWKLMMFGAHIFTVKDGELAFAPEPAVPAYLIPENGILETTLLSGVKVNYHFADVKDYIPGSYEIRSMKFLYHNGTVADTKLSYAQGTLAEDIRKGRVAEIVIEIG